MRAGIQQRAKDPIEGSIRWMMALFVAGMCAVDYGNYHQELMAEPQRWTDVLAGRANAPEQYRIGAIETANWLTEHVRWHGYGLRLDRAFGLLDFASAEIAVLVLFGLLLRSRVFARASEADRRFGMAGFAALVFYLIHWAHWYQKVETLPSACVVALLLWVWTLRCEPSTRLAAGTRGAAFLLLIVVQSFLRAEIALVIGLGVALAAIAGLGTRDAVSRGSGIAMGGTAALLAGGVQLWLAKSLYPQATYGGVHVWMIAHDWWRLPKWSFAGIFLAPLLWTLFHVVRRRSATEGAGGAFLLAGCGHAILWLLFGRLDEVRIFLPLALALTPLAVETAMVRPGGGIQFRTSDAAASEGHTAGGTESGIPFGSERC